MKISKVLQIAWKGVSKNKMRALLTMLGVIIGVAAVIVMVAISAGTEATISEQINSLGSNLLFISEGVTRGNLGGGGNSTGLTFDDMSLLEAKVSDITGTSTERPTIQTVKADDIILEEITLLGTTSDYPDVRDIPVGEGRFFNDQEMDRKTKVVVLGYDIAQILFGDENPIGLNVTVGTTRLTVIGVMAERGVVNGQDVDMVLYTPITVVFQKFANSQFARIAGDRVNTIYAQIDPEANLDDVIFDIQLVLAESKDMLIEDVPFSIQTQQDLIATQEATTEAFRSLLAWVAAVSLVVGGIGIMNIMLVSVTERTREIGIRQSVGATMQDIRMQFLAESLMLSLVGGLIGVLIGVGGAWLFNLFGGMRTVIIPSSIVLAFASSAVVGIVFGYYPANAAAQLDPIDALRYE